MTEIPYPFQYRLLAQLRTYESALEFYADNHNYDVIDSEFLQHRVDLDGGKRAEEALRASPQPAPAPNKATGNIQRIDLWQAWCDDEDTDDDDLFAEWIERHYSDLQDENKQLRLFVNSVYRRAQNSGQINDLSAFILYELGIEAAALLASLLQAESEGE